MKNFFICLTIGLIFSQQLAQSQEIEDKNVLIVWGGWEGHNPKLFSDIVEDWTLLKQYDYSTSFGVKKVSDVFVDSEQNRKFISHGNQTLFSGTQPGTGLTLPPQAFGLTVLPPAATPTISNTGIFTTITTPTLPSGTTLTQASANQGYYYEVYSDSPFSIVFTTGNGVQRKFDGVFDIVVLSKTLPVVLNTVSNQQYTTYQGVFDMGDSPTSGVPNPANNGTLVSGSFGTSGLTSLGHYIIRDAFLYYGFIPKVYVNGFWRTDPEASDANAATNLKTYSLYVEFIPLAKVIFAAAEDKVVDVIKVIAPVATPLSKAPASNNVVPFEINPILTILNSVKFKCA